MRIHYIIHESYEGPAAIGIWANKHGHSQTYTRLSQGDLLPESLQNVDLLVVLGGPQSTTTTLEECSYFNAVEEIALIRKAVIENKGVLGICLGAQLLGESFGGKCEPSPEREIGVFDVELTSDAEADPFFSKLPKKFLVGHWHGDMPGVGAEAKVLAKSKGCPRQVIRYAPLAYGFQAHFEFTPEAIEEMIEASQVELEKHAGKLFVQNASQLRSHDYQGMNQMLFGFLNFLESKIMEVV